MKKKVLSTVLAFTMVVSALAGCGSAATETTTTSDTQQTTSDAGTATDNTAAATATETAAPAAELTGIDAIIAEAETMSMEELAKKAIETEQESTVIIRILKLRDEYRPGAQPDNAK